MGNQVWCDLRAIIVVEFCGMFSDRLTGISSRDTEHFPRRCRRLSDLGERAHAEHRGGDTDLLIDEFEGLVAEVAASRHGLDGDDRLSGIADGV